MSAHLPAIDAAVESLEAAAAAVEASLDGPPPGSLAQYQLERGRLLGAVVEAVVELATELRHVAIELAEHVEPATEPEPEEPA